MKSPKKQENSHNLKIRLLAAGISLFTGIVLTVVKFYTFSLTHSSAILSDALESIINIVAGIFVVMSIWLTSKPPDESHPYGHGKIEYFSAGFEGALIIIAAIGIFKIGLEHLLIPHQLPNIDAGLLLLGGTAIINLILGFGLIKVGRQTSSITLSADGKHILTDVYTSVGVVLGLIIVRITGLLWIDGAIACLVGLNILFTGKKLIQQSIAGLMDKSDPELLDRIAALLSRHKQKYWINIHQLRAWRAGDLINIDLHLVLPRDFSIIKAHDEARKLEIMLANNFDQKISVLVHMDPCDQPECLVCRRYQCSLRSHEAGGTLTWDRKNLILNKNDK